MGTHLLADREHLGRYVIVAEFDVISMTKARAATSLFAMQHGLLAVEGSGTIG